MYEFHGHTLKDRIYRIWLAMRQRCSDPKREGFSLYGGRGIRVCETWNNSFTAFKAWADASGYRADLSIDRIDPDGHYEPSNCRWVTPAEQHANRRPCGILVEYRGEVRNLREWSERTGIYYTTLNRRYHKGRRGDSLFAPVQR